MRLFSNPLSPFARKVRVAAHELGLSGLIEIVDLAMSPVAPNTELLRHNPLGKLPTLLLADGAALFDSSVIVAHLDRIAGPRLLPTRTAEREEVLRLEALGDGIAEAAVAARYEAALRPQPLQWHAWTTAQLSKVTRALDYLERTLVLRANAVSVGEISIGCALGYLDTRFPDLRWRESRPNLNRWEQNFGARPSMMATRLTPADTTTER